MPVERQLMLDTQFSETVNGRYFDITVWLDEVGAYVRIAFRTHNPNEAPEESIKQTSPAGVSRHIREFDPIPKRLDLSEDEKKRLRDAYSELAEKSVRLLPNG